MNRQDVLALLGPLFAGFWCHPNLRFELSNIISKSGYEVKFFNLLLMRLKYLLQNGRHAINYKEGFEELKHSKGLYSMRLKGNGFNVRILYSFASDGQPMLLLGFEEKAGKKNTDYTNFIPEAERRLQAREEAAHE